MFGKRKDYEKVSLLLYPVAIVCHQVLFQSNKVKLFSQLYVIFPTFYCRKYTLQLKAIRYRLIIVSLQSVFCYISLVVVPTRFCCGSSPLFSLTTKKQATKLSSATFQKMLSPRISY